MTIDHPGGSVEINGRAVRYHRIYTAGLTMTALAEVCEVSQPYISMIESGRRTHVRPAVFKRLREALQVQDMNVLLANQPELAASHK